MKPLQLENLNKYLLLRNELSSIDPYVLKIDYNELKQQLLEENTPTSVHLMESDTHVCGFIELSQTPDTQYIETLFLTPDLANLTKNTPLECYETLIKHAIKIASSSDIKFLKYIGVNKNDTLNQAFINTDMVLMKEHIQMEMPLLDNQYKSHDLNVTAFNQFKDVTQLNDLMKACMAGSAFNYSLEEVEELTKAENELALILWADSVPVGFIIAHINPKRNAQQGVAVVYVEQLAIAPTHRQLGYAKKLMETIFNKAQSKGMEIARLHVYNDNHEALNLYQSRGFQEVKRIGHWCKKM